MAVKGLPGGRCSVGQGRAHAEASMEHAPSGARLAMEVQVPKGQQETILKKRSRYRIKSPRALNARPGV